MRAFTTRDKLIRSAIDLCAAKGVAGVNFADLAKKTKNSPQLVQYHFSTLDELHLACCQIAGSSLGTYTTESLAKLPATATAKEALMEYVAVTFRWAQEHPKYFKLILYMYYTLVLSEELRLVNESVRRVGRQRIENMIYRGIERKEWQGCGELSVAECATVIQGLLTGQVTLTFTEPDLDYEAMVGQTQRAVMALLA